MQQLQPLMQQQQLPEQLQIQQRQQQQNAERALHPVRKQLDQQGTARRLLRAYLCLH
jgi:hypothetical protein